MTERHTLTTKQKLEVLIRYSRCPECGERFDGLDSIDWDHIGQLEITGDNSLENFRPLHRDGCHKRKTAKDARDRAHGRRLTREQERFRAVVTAKSGQGEAPAPRKSKWPSRPFQKRAKRKEA